MTDMKYLHNVGSISSYLTLFDGRVGVDGCGGVGGCVGGCGDGGCGGDGVVCVGGGCGRALFFAIVQI